MAKQEDVAAYCKELFEEVNAEFTSYEEGATPEQVFTEHALQLLAEAGETENYHVCYDEKQGKRGTDHKINAYSLYENYETLDLFITIYVPSDEVKTVTKFECEKAFRRLMHFFVNTLNKGYVNEIEESSEIYDLANTLYNVQEVKDYLTRVNLFILTNGEVTYEYSTQENIAGFPVYNRIIDINYLFNISVKTGLPIEINFQDMGYNIQCIGTEAANGEYKSYLAIMPGKVLSAIYEQYGPRLLEQNVRSFLQFTGKINKGIRKTIIEEPHMFFAFNNGIAATADDLILADSENGKIIVTVCNFQIVNGGQTTASIYHTSKKNNTDISQIVVPIKLTILNDKAKIPITVGRIAECANTQNKVSASDLSSNREGFIILDSISRSLWAPPRKGTTQQTRWFFERARGQYKNERNRLGYTVAKRKAFDLKNPRSQIFTKEQLAKYVNCVCEIWKGSKCVIGPHNVVRGNQKNYVQFLTHNFRDMPDTKYFEDTVGKAILFASMEKIYGVKPNSIGDLRYITVPYSIAWLSYKLENRIDFYKIWQAQELPSELESSFRRLMIFVEQFIKKNAPGALYGEWAKKEDCWISLKSADIEIDPNEFSTMITTTSDLKSIRSTNFDLAKAQSQQYSSEVKDLGGENWKKIYLWCKATDKVPLFYTDMAHTIGKKVQNGLTLTGREIVAGFTLLNDLTEKGIKLETILNCEYEA